MLQHKKSLSAGESQGEQVEISVQHTVELQGEMPPPRQPPQPGRNLPEGTFTLGHPPGVDHQVSLF